MSAYATPLREKFRVRREAIADAVRHSGKTYQQIATEFGICRERVRQIAKKYGIERRPAKPRNT